MTLTNVVFVKHENSTKNYLFCVPERQDLKQGDTVICRTVKGIEYGACATGSFFVSNVEELVGAVGAYLPLKEVVGKVVKETVSKVVSLVDDDIPY